MNEFEKCARWILSGDREEWRVCHGMVVGDHNEDHFAHCWIEHPDDNVAIILSGDRGQLVPADTYRHMMSAYTIDEFTAEQIAHLVGHNKHFGPFNADLADVPTRVIH